MPLKRSPVASVAALALALALACCTPPVPHVVRGEALVTGQAEYDDFFKEVKLVRTDARAAPADEDSSHAGLVKALGLEAGTKRRAVLDESVERAKRLLDKGVFLHLELTPEAHLLTAHGKVDIGPDGEAMLRAMEDAAKASLDKQKRFMGIAARAAALEKKRADLRGRAASDFRAVPQARRDEVIAELDAAQRVIAEALDTTERAAGSASRFAVELAQAVETGAEEAAAKSAKRPFNRRTAVTLQYVPPAPSASAPASALPPAAPPLPPPPPASPPPKPAASKPAPPPSKPAASKPPPSKPAPAPAKKKPKGGGDDFEP